jgi:hypothetical protein
MVSSEVVTQQISGSETPSMTSTTLEKHTVTIPATTATQDNNATTMTPTTEIPSTTSSGHTILQPTRLIEVMDATLTAEDSSDFDVDVEHPLLFAFAASADPDTMYLHEAVRQSIDFSS